MKKLGCLLIIYLSLISWTKKNHGALLNAATIVDTIHKSYLALGDSYTIGESVTNTGTFPLQTAMLLKEHNININNPDIIAITGWTTSDLLHFLDNNPLKKTYSCVTVLIGVNNQYQGKMLNEYTIEFTELLNRAIVYAGNIKGHVFVLSIPDYSVTPFASGLDTAKIAREIDAFNLVNRNITEKTGAHYIDITPISRNAKNDTSLIATDGLHPSAVQYKKWAGLLVPMMLKELH